jgi:ligand-binding sensor domain-containing protein/serine phosphatase RsbU (regulator of sigma subunit)
MFLYVLYGSRKMIVSNFTRLTQILLVLCLFPIVTQAQNYYFENYGVQQGIPNSKVYNIIQDNNGYVWIGTPSGLCKFDGINFISFGKTQGLPESALKALFIDSREKLWVGFENSQIFVKDTFGFAEIICDSINANVSISDFTENKNGHILISTVGSGLFMIKNQGESNEEIIHYGGKNNLSDIIYQTISLENGDVFFATDVDLKYLPADSSEIMFFRPQGFPTFFLTTSILHDSKGNLWIGKYNGGLYKYNIENQEFIFFDHRNGLARNFISTLFEDSHGNIWVGTWGGGISIINDDKIIINYNVSNGLQGQNIHKICEDSEANILIATHENGFYIYKGNQFLSFTEENGLHNDQIWALCLADSNKLWIGTNHGIAVLSVDKNKKFSIIKTFQVENSSLIGNKIRNLCCDDEGNIWIGTALSGIQKFDITKNKFIYDHFLNSNIPKGAKIISSMFIDNDNLYAGTVDGLLNYEIPNGKTYRISQETGLSGNDISSLYLDSKNTLWIGIRNKGISYIIEKTVTSLPKTAGITPVTFCESPEGDLWVGTYKGVYILQNDSLKLILDKQTGLLSNYVTLLTFGAKGDLFIGSNNGLNKFDFKNKLITNFTQNIGFTGIETKANAVVKLNEHSILFGTTYGLMIYNQQANLFNTKEPFIDITGIEVNLKDRKIIQDQIFPYYENSFLFSYHGICLSNEKAVKYKIMLKGIDNDWRPVTTQQTISFSHLQSGEYEFLVKACNNNNIWNEIPTSYRFSIKPPIWKTRWFITLVSLLIIIILVIVVKYRIYLLKKEKEILENKVKERTLEISDKNILLAEKNKHITDSINYARRIQYATMRSESELYSIYPNSFILYLPKDIVSGDFYWYIKKGKHLIVAAVDCTGHGVPGAFISMLGIALLNEITGKMNRFQAANILGKLRKNVIKALHQSNSFDSFDATNDGMDIALLVLDINDRKLQYAGAYNPLFIYRQNELLEYKADRMPIGIHIKSDRRFVNHEIQLEKDDQLFIFTDGFADQFGGPKGKKFNIRNFKKLLADTCTIEKMDDKRKFLLYEFNEWKNDLEQLDDVLVIGIKVV